MGRIVKYVYLLFEKPADYHHNVFRYAFADKPTAEQYIRNHYDDVVHNQEAHVVGKAYYEAKTKKSKIRVTLIIQKEQIHFGSPDTNVMEEIK